MPNISPILPSDLARVAQFLHNHHNSSITTEMWLKSFVYPWCPEQPNHGYMLLDDQRIVGTMGAVYSNQVIAGKSERFCNLAHWCVLDSFRNHSMRLLMEVINQEGYHFTNLTPLPVVEKTLSFLKFRRLEDHHTVIPVLPHAATCWKAQIHTTHDSILAYAPSILKTPYNDHCDRKGLQHVLVGRPDAWLYLVFRKIRVRRLKGVMVLHSSDPELFNRYLGAICRYLLLYRGVLAIRSDSRFLQRTPLGSVKQALRVAPLYRSSTLTPAQITNLYSELVTLES